MLGFPRRLICDGSVSVFLSDLDEKACIDSPGSAMSASSRDSVKLMKIQFSLNKSIQDAE